MLGLALWRIVVRQPERVMGKPDMISPSRPTVHRRLVSAIHPTGSLTIEIRPGLNRVQQLHGGDVVNVYLRFKHHDEPFPIHLHSKDRRWKGELAYCGLTLWSARPELRHRTFVLTI